MEAVVEGVLAGALGHPADAGHGRAAGARARGRASRSSTRPSREAATHWRLDRIAPVDRTILRLGAYELLAEPGTPAAVVLDEAVELAKRFGEADSPAFVNGVLDAIRRRTRAAGMRRRMSDDEQGRPRRAPSRRSPAGRRSRPSASRRRAALRELGVAPYPTRFERTHRLGEIVRGLRREVARGARGARRSRCASPGRVVTKRGHGKASFATLADGESRLQVYVRSDEVGEEAYRRPRPRRPRRLRRGGGDA